MSDSSLISKGAEISAGKTVREIWERAVAHQCTRDIDAWVESFAMDGVIEWPFTPMGVPKRAEGRGAIRAAVAPVWEQAKKTGRKIMGHDRVVVHETADPEVAVIEFDVFGENAGAPFRQSMLYVLRVRAGKIVHLRDYVDSAGLNDLIRQAAAKVGS